MNQQPLVSIVIPAYKPTFFEEALQSACKQDYPNIEIIVSDDNTNGGIFRILKKYQDNSKFPIFYYKTETQLFEQKNLFNAVTKSNGEYIKFLYDDDILKTDCVSKLVDVIISDDNISLVSSRRHRIDELGHILDDIQATSVPFTEDVIVPGDTLISYLADYPINFIGEPSCVLCRRKDLIELGESFFQIKNMRTPYLGDLSLYVNLLKKGNLAFLIEALSCFRVSEEQGSQKIKNLATVSINVGEKFGEIIRAAGYYKGDKYNNQLVDIHPLNCSGESKKINLIVSINKAFSTQKIKSWLNKRASPESLKLSLKEYFSYDSEKLILVVKVDDKIRIPYFMSSIEFVEICELMVSEFVFITNKNELIKYNKSEILIFKNKTDVISHINEIALSNRKDWLLFIDENSKVTHHGLVSILLGTIGDNGYDAVYGDELYKDSHGDLETAFRTDFNLDYFLSIPAIMGRHWIFKCNTVADLGGFDITYSSSFEMEYIIRLIERRGMHVLGHIAEPIIIAYHPELKHRDEEITIIKNHLYNRGYTNAQVKLPSPGQYRLCYQHDNTPLVSIIIPTKDQLAMLKRCVTSLLERTKYFNYEIIIVDNNSELPETLVWLNEISNIDPNRIKVLRYPHPFNYSAINNAAAKLALGEYLVLLNNDTAIIQDDWLSNMLNHGMRPEVGIVGAKLLYPNGNIQHAGVILGLRGGPAEHVFVGDPMKDHGYLYKLDVDQNYTVVTAACLLIRKSVYLEVGGLDETLFKVSYNDVDLCLKVREAGYLTVWTPYAIVVHEGSVSQNQVDQTVAEAKKRRFLAEQDAMYMKWLPLIGKDPAYNINLPLNGYESSLDDSELTWLPAPLPLIIAHGIKYDFYEYSRLITPFEFMKKEELINGSVSKRILGIPEVSRFNADSLIFNQKIYLADEFYEWIERIKRLTNSYMVYDLNELIMPSLNRQALDKVKKVLSVMDKITVSSDQLANFIFSEKLHSNISVLHTKLSYEQWNDFSLNKLISDKPRLGWVSDSSLQYHGEFEFFYKLVKSLSDKVDWIVLGNCPEKFKPYIHEIYEIPRAEYYPAKLSSLNLDIALVPLASNVDSIYHSCNIRIMEHGMCGVPVICSKSIYLNKDIPVSRVTNKYKDWSDKINEHLADLKSARNLGNQFKEYSDNNSIVKKDTIENWLSAWLPH
ncbi:glycosyltransferase [Pectobacterium polaris]|uniref:glycosyltransferase n=1 Tax=Pectobacterium polaris TaxID=2042057 RepID=UPI00158387E8|nr:glycosyltransferase [Pectobacterium polaris]